MGRKLTDEEKIKRLDREWKIELKSFYKIWEPLKKEVRKDFVSMINWLLFYKPKNRWDKTTHIIEVVIAWLIIQFAWIGIRW